ncbi:hypothetical protein ACVWWG_005182 [Bradyrhizobium sp. LB7.2]|jgi:hypothetical protein|uniref:hypothetical protein n=1 Tax=unclassified Bradyrhizobium TaxID=2631580 RepID=UPI0004892101|nr:MULTISPECIES: hypothetical protein [unclassified Bradyrhizobium]MCK1341555.1 hypothetical protein [Bradyrhizobium sp. 38]MCK1778914.1 hypothetical protein [Bradyrhizobium sp. 132]
MFIPVEAEEPVAHGVVVPGMVEPYAVPEVLGSGTDVIGLSPLVSASVAPSGIVLPTTFDIDPGV